MNWDGFGPLILPYATTCPVPLLEHHARLAAIDFLSHTKAWRADLAPVVGDGVLTAFTLVAPTDAQIEKLLAVVITDAYGNVTEANVKVDLDGARLSRMASSSVLAYLQGRKLLAVKPVQATGASIVATVALKPTLTAATIPDEVFEQYGQFIANGALAKLTSMANKPWTDPTTARINGAEFINAKAVTARQAERGFAKSGRRSATRWC